MPKKEKIIEKYQYPFEGIGMQEIRVYLDKDSGLFTCQVPKKVIKPCNSILPEAKPTIVVDTQYLCEKEYHKIIFSIKEAATKFGQFDREYRRVILIKFENYTSYMDGSGRGLHLNWGVFRKYEDDELVLESSHPGETHKHHSYQHYNDWKEVPYSDAVRDFLLKLDKTIDDVREKLDTIINSPNFEQKIDDLKLIG